MTFWKLRAPRSCNSQVSHVLCCVQPRWFYVARVSERRMFRRIKMRKLHERTIPLMCSSKVYVLFKASPSVFSIDAPTCDRHRRKKIQLLKSLACSEETDFRSKSLRQKHSCRSTVHSWRWLRLPHSGTVRAAYSWVSSAYLCALTTI